jgi:hypothetical protein
MLSVVAALPPPNPRQKPIPMLAFFRERKLRCFIRLKLMERHSGNIESDLSRAHHPPDSAPALTPNDQPERETSQLRLMDMCAIALTTSLSIRGTCMVLGHAGLELGG